VVAYQDMYIELGNALMKRELWDRALECFATINEEDSVGILNFQRVPLIV
jgi:hypothetical protein